LWALQTKLAIYWSDDFATDEEGEESRVIEATNEVASLNSSFNAHSHMSMQRNLGGVIFLALVTKALVITVLGIEQTIQSIIVHCPYRHYSYYANWHYSLVIPASNYSHYLNFVLVKVGWWRSLSNCKLKSIIWLGNVLNLRWRLENYVIRWPSERN
jgi:hypothetical protein